MLLDEPFPNLHHDHVAIAVLPSFLPSFRVPNANTSTSTRFPVGPGGSAHSHCSLTQINVLSLETLEHACLEMSIPGRIPQENYCGLHLGFVSQRYVGWEAGEGV